jgi:hypothetical protein
MSCCADQDTALACEPTALTPEVRGEHFALIRQLFGKVEERADLSNGYAYRFAADEIGSVVRFIDNERRCCPFLHFELSANGSEPLWLRMTGPEGTREFLDAELQMERG